jgi:hypothetical protein
MAFKFNHRDRLRYVTHRSSTTVIRIFKACRSATQQLTKSSRSAAATRFE